jgi:hypothetical protein
MIQPNVTTSSSRKNRSVSVTFENISGEPVFHLPKCSNDLHLSEEYGEVDDVFQNLGGKPVYFIEGSSCTGKGVPEEIDDKPIQGRGRGGKSERDEALRTLLLQHGAADEQDERQREIKIENHGVIKEHNVHRDNKLRVKNELHDDDNDITKVKVKQETKLEIKVEVVDAKSMQSGEYLPLPCLCSHFLRTYVELQLECGSGNEQPWENHASLTLTADVIKGKRKHGNRDGGMYDTSPFFLTAASDSYVKFSAEPNSAKRRKYPGPEDRGRTVETNEENFHEALIDRSESVELAAADEEGSDSDGEVNLEVAHSHGKNAKTKATKIKKKSRIVRPGSLQLFMPANVTYVPM